MSSGEINSNPSSIEVKLCYLIQLPVYLTVKNMSIHNQEKGGGGFKRRRGNNDHSSTGERGNNGTKG